MVTKTRDKLNEAKFFLKRMENEQAEHEVWTDEDRDHFRYYFSAFVSAARSVTKLHSRIGSNWYLEEEFSSAAGFDEWYQRKNTELQGDKLMDFFKGQRNITIHFKGKQSITFASRSTRVIDMTASLSYGDQVVDSQSIEASHASPVEQVIPSPTRAWVFTNFPADIALDNVVIPVCQEYITKLEQIVDECEARFS